MNDMKLDLHEVAAHLGKRIKYEINEPPIEDVGVGLACVEPIEGEVSFTNAGSSIVARGAFRTVVELDCSRCLSPYSLNVEAAIEEELPLTDRGPESPPDDEKAELPEEEKEPLFVDNVFDLEELLRQSILIAVPIKPVCSEECKGLCARCGRNLNEQPCTCPPEEAASPFAILASLLQEDEGPKG